MKVLLGFVAAALLAGCAQPPGMDAMTLLQGPIATDGLVGSTPGILDAEFGEPALRRVDGTAQVWLYHTPTCGLNLILYPDQAGTPRVAMAAPTADSADEGDCTASLQRAHVATALEHPTSS